MDQSKKDVDEDLQFLEEMEKQYLNRQEPETDTVREKDADKNAIRKKEPLRKDMNFYCPVCRNELVQSDLQEKTFDLEDGWITNHWYECKTCRTEVVNGNGEKIFWKTRL